MQMDAASLQTEAAACTSKRCTAATDTGVCPGGWVAVLAAVGSSAQSVIQPQNKN